MSRAELQCEVRRLHGQIRTERAYGGAAVLALLAVLMWMVTYG